MSLIQQLVDDICLQNNFSMVKTTGVRGPTLARLATASVCRAGGKPSTGFPPGTRRAEQAFSICSQDFLHIVHIQIRISR